MRFVYRILMLSLEDSGLMMCDDDEVDFKVQAGLK